MHPGTIFLRWKRKRNKIGSLVIEYAARIGTAHTCGQMASDFLCIYYLTVARCIPVAAEAKKQLAHVREERADKFTVTIARRELRAWLCASEESKAVETAVGKLLAGG